VTSPLTAAVHTGTSTDTGSGTDTSTRRTRERDGNCTPTGSAADGTAREPHRTFHSRWRDGKVSGHTSAVDRDRGRTFSGERCGDWLGTYNRSQDGTGLVPSVESTQTGLYLQ